MFRLSPAASYVQRSFLGSVQVRASLVDLGQKDDLTLTGTPKALIRMCSEQPGHFERSRSFCGEMLFPNRGRRCEPCCFQASKSKKIGCNQAALGIEIIAAFGLCAPETWQFPGPKASP